MVYFYNVQKILSQDILYYAYDDPLPAAAMWFTRLLSAAVVLVVPGYWWYYMGLVAKGGFYPEVRVLIVVRSERRRMRHSKSGML